MPAFYPGVHIDDFIIMPDHIHRIVMLVGATPRGRPNPDAGVVPDADGSRYAGVPADGLGHPPVDAPTGVMALGDVVHRFKSMTTKRYADGVKQWGWRPFRGRLWQRNYYEHIIGSEGALHRIRQYVRDNPARWNADGSRARRRNGS